MSSIASICTVIKHEFKELETKLSLLSLASKKQCEYIDMLYYILENDTPLFIELFGGQILKVPTKNEFLKAENGIRLFLYTIAHANKTNPFIHTSYKFGVYMDRVYANFIDNYEIFIMNKPISEIELDVTEEDIKKLEDMYSFAKKELCKIKSDSSLNKRYSKNKNVKSSTNETDGFPNSAMEQESSEDDYSYLDSEFDYNFDKDEDDGILSTLNNTQDVDDDDDGSSRQLSLF